MCHNLAGDFGKTAGGLMPWKGQASLVNQAYIKPKQEAKQAAKDAATAEAQRQARISQNVSDINSAFAGREGQYQDFGNALRSQYDDALALQRGEAQRQNKFALARGGLTGGSAAIDAGRQLQRENDQGVLQAERQVQKGVADLRSSDEQARTQLIGLAQSGNDIGNAGAQTAAIMRANLQGAGTTNPAMALGDVFGQTAQTYRAMQDAAQRRRGLKEAQLYAGSFARGQ